MRRSLTRRRRRRHRRYMSFERVPGVSTIHGREARKCEASRRSTRCHGSTQKAPRSSTLHGTQLAATRLCWPARRSTGVISDVIAPPCLTHARHRRAFEAIPFFIMPKRPEHSSDSQILKISEGAGEVQVRRRGRYLSGGPDLERLPPFLKRSLPTQ